MDLGLEAAGFTPAICVEIDDNSRDTLRVNRPAWRLSEPGDIEVVNPQELLAQAGLRPGEAALVSAGPGCQPFSHAARWTPNGARGLDDPRASTLAASLELIEVAKPQAALFENVHGFTREDAGALDYMGYRIDEINSRHRTNYRLQTFNLNSVEFGVPQARRRSFVVAERDGRFLPVPEPTHGTDGTRYITAWDAIGALEGLEKDNHDLVVGGKWAGLLPSVPEGRNYLWHTNRGGGLDLFGWRTRYWTFLLKLAKDRPSWTLTAHPGSATGPFHWKNRKLSIREMSRLQTFPDEYRIVGSYYSQRRQIGNAVPCLLAEVLGKTIAKSWFASKCSDDYRYRVRPRRSCPPPEPVGPVRSSYLGLRGSHERHPGAGMGPAARRSLTEQLTSAKA